MSVEVISFSVTKNDYSELEKIFQCPYLQLRPDFNLEGKDIIELFLVESEIDDIVEKLSILHLGGH